VLDWLLECIKTHSIRLVIIDTLQRFCRFKDANDYSQVINMMEPLLDAAREAKIHLLFTHHAKKDSGDDLDSAIGSTAIRGMAYTYLHLKRLPESERRILRSDQRGGKNIPETAIGFDAFTGTIEAQGSREEAEIEEMKPKIVAALEEEDELSERQVLAAVAGRAIIVSKCLRELFHLNEVSRSGKGKRGDPFKYSSSLSLPLKKEKSSNSPGRETENTVQPIENTRQILFPPNREELGRAGKRNGNNSDEFRQVTDFIDDNTLPGVREENTPPMKRRGITIEDIFREFPGAELTASIGGA